jgi:sugar fermentation stimulation protein A|nr:sugar fermentation stimulation protein [Phenylobacterium sp.]
MEYPTPLVRGRLIQRYKRFLADIVLDDGTEITAHCPNPGAMLGLNMPGLTCWLSYDPSPKRKLPYTWELVEAPSANGGFLPVGLNTMHPNRLVAEALAADAIPELTGYATHRREVKYGANSRVDFLLEAPGRAPCWLEVKNCHLRRSGTLAEFPDCVAARSLKHLKELTAMVEAGQRAAMLFVIQRTDCDAFSACYDLDPAYARGLTEAAANGVEVLAYACEIAVEGVRVSRPVPWSR